VDAIQGELDLIVEVSRETFNTLNEALFQKCMLIVDKTLKEIQMTQADVDDVILVGGSSRIPKIQELIMEYFGGRKPSVVMRGDLAVAHGAAIVASMLSNSGGVSSNLESKLNINFRDVVPVSIGISAIDNHTGRLGFFPIVDKNTPVPCMRKKKFVTSVDNQELIRIGVYEGEEKDPNKDFFLGEFDATHLPVNSLKGEPVGVHIQVDQEGIVEVTVSYRSSGIQDKHKLDTRLGRLGKDELLRLKLELAEGFNFELS
jgi:molecular chaperone DnaK (HSP70)